MARPTRAWSATSSPTGRGRPCARGGTRWASRARSWTAWPRRSKRTTRAGGGGGRGGRVPRPPAPPDAGGGPGAPPASVRWLRGAAATAPVSAGMSVVLSRGTQVGRARPERALGGGSIEPGQGGGERGAGGGGDPGGRGEAIGGG